MEPHYYGYLLMGLRNIDLKDEPKWALHIYARATNI